MDAEQINNLIDQYARHGWKLRRAFGSPEFSRIVLDREPNVQVAIDELDGIWFSRRSLTDAESWELRRFSGSPFALVVVVPDSDDESDRELVLAETEDRMKSETAGRDRLRAPGH